MSLLGHEMGRRSLWTCIDTSLWHGSMMVTFVTAFRCEGTTGGGVNDEGERLTRELRCFSQSKVNMTRSIVQCRGSEGEWTVSGRAKDGRRCHEVQYGEGGLRCWRLLTLRRFVVFTVLDASSTMVLVTLALP